jgi:hypothetical protein
LKTYQVQVGGLDCQGSLGWGDPREANRDKRCLVVGVYAAVSTTVAILAVVVHGAGRVVAGEGPRMHGIRPSNQAARSPEKVLTEARSASYGDAAGRPGRGAGETVEKTPAPMEPDIILSIFSRPPFGQDFQYPILITKQL